MEESSTHAFEGGQLEAIRRAALGAVHVVAERQDDLQQLPMRHHRETIENHRGSKMVKSRDLLERRAVDEELAALEHGVDLRRDGHDQLVEEANVGHDPEPTE